MASFQSRDEFLENHERLAELVITRSGETAIRALSEHIASTLRLVYPERAES